MSYYKTKHGRTVYFLTSQELNQGFFQALFKGLKKPYKKRRYKSIAPR